MRHSWVVKADEPPFTIWQCLRCMARLRSEVYEPSLRSHPRTMTLAGRTVVAARKEALPECTGRGKVERTLQGRHYVKERV